MVSLPVEVVEFVYSGLHWEGDPTTIPIGILLGLEAHFELRVAGERIYSDPYFCLIEFAVQARTWLDVGAARGENFAYVSIEAEEPGLVWFRRSTGDVWHVGSVFQEVASTHPVNLSEITRPLRALYSKVRDESRDRFGVLVDSL